VLSVIRNLIRFSQEPQIKNHVIFTLNEKMPQDFVVPKIFGAEDIKIFRYSSRWNFYHTCRQLAKLLPDEKAVLVAHDWLELGMASNLGLQNPVVQFLHGDYDYYYELAEKHAEAIDEFICVSPVIARKLILRLPDRKDDIHDCRFPVQEVLNDKKFISEKIRILFCVRDINDESKQFNLLPRVHELLSASNCEIQWTIIGGGKSEDEIKPLLGSDAKYFSSLNNQHVLEEMKQNDILIHPSLIEGFPVVVVEAMKAGLVPLITDWAGSTKDLVVEGETGFYLTPKDALGYAEKIRVLNGNRNLLAQLSENAKRKAEQLFNPYHNTQIIEGVYCEALKKEREKLPKRVYGSRLDKRWIPNWVVERMRRKK